MMDVKAHSLIHAIESRYSCKIYKTKLYREIFQSQLLEYMDNIHAVENETDP